jgi:hypothetical protein
MEAKSKMAQRYIRTIIFVITIVTVLCFLLVVLHRPKFQFRFVLRKWKQFLHRHNSSRSYQKMTSLYLLQRLLSQWKFFLRQGRQQRQSTALKTASSKYYFQALKSGFLLYQQKVRQMKQQQTIWDLAENYSDTATVFSVLDKWKYYAFDMNKRSCENNLTVKRFLKSKYFQTWFRQKENGLHQSFQLVKSLKWFKYQKWKKFRHSMKILTNMNEIHRKNYYYLYWKKSFLHKLRSFSLRSRVFMRRNYEKGRNHYHRKVKIRFCILLINRILKRKELLKTVVYHRLRRSLVQWNYMSNCFLQQKMRLKRGEIRNSSKLLSDSFVFWWQQMQQKMILRRKYFFYQNLQKYSYFRHNRSSDGGFPIADNNDGSVSPLSPGSSSSYYYSEIIYSRKLQILKHYFIDWKDNYFIPQKRIKNYLSNLYHNYQLELQRLIFNYWFLKYEKKRINKINSQLYLKRWMNYTMKRKRFLNHLEDVILSKKKEKLFRQKKDTHDYRRSCNYSHSAVVNLLSFSEFFYLRIKNLSSRAVVDIDFYEENELAHVKPPNLGGSDMAELKSRTRNSLYQNCFLFSFFRAWYKRYSQKYLYYHSLVPNTFQKCIGNIRETISREESKIMKIHQIRKRFIFLSWKRKYFYFYHKLLHIQQMLYMKPYFYHWMRLYNYYTMKNILEIPSLISKNVVSKHLSEVHQSVPSSSFHTPLLESVHHNMHTMVNEEQLSQHLQSLKSKISLHHNHHHHHERKLSDSSSSLPQKNRSLPSLGKNKKTLLVGDLSYVDRSFPSRDQKSTTPLRSNSVERKAKIAKPPDPPLINKSSSVLFNSTFLQEMNNDFSQSKDYSRRINREKEVEDNSEITSEDSLTIPHPEVENQPTPNRIDYNHSYQEFIQNRSYLGSYEMKKQQQLLLSSSKK